MRISDWSSDVCSADLLRRQAIRLGMYRRGIERLAATADAQKAGALLERLRPESRHFQQLAPGLERPGLIAMRDDRLGQRSAEPRHARDRKSTRLNSSH